MSSLNTVPHFELYTPHSYRSCITYPALLFIFLLPALLLTAHAETVDYNSPGNLRRFADALYEQQDYLRAAGEYQRYLFVEPNATESLLLKISRCYRLGGKPEQALRYLNRLLAQHADHAVIQATEFALGETYFYLGKYGYSLEILEHTLSNRSLAFRFPSQQLFGLNLLMQKRWQTASKYWTSLAAEPLLPEQLAGVLHYQELAEAGMHLPQKSPFIAGTFSTLVPGAGRLYVGRRSDALMTIFVLGLAGWQAYDGFAEDGVSSTKGWLVGTLGSVFYLGNVYGSVVAAKVHNREAEAMFLASIPLP